MATENKAAENESLDLAGMMDETLDNIAEVPDYINPPSGSYTLSVKDCITESYMNKKLKAQCQRIRVTYSVLATLELSKSDEQPVPDGSMFSETFTGTVQGLGYFKKAAKAIMNVSTLDGVALRDIIASIKGSAFDAILTVKQTPKEGSTTEFYENVSMKVVAPVAG